jgi:hypothetical protein
MSAYFVGAIFYEVLHPCALDETHCMVEGSHLHCSIELTQLDQAEINYVGMGEQNTCFFFFFVIRYWSLLISAGLKKFIEMAWHID